MALDGDDGLDTKLARLLHERGRVELGVLQTMLSEARSGHTTLAGSLVTRGVLPQDEAERFLNELGVAPVPRDDGLSSSLWTSGEASGERFAWREGTEVGVYRLEKKLGQGAMGMVFLATHLPTGSPCALKTLSFQADEALRERFVREGQAQARVDNHPNVVRVHTAGEVGGALYMVMDLASGGDLEDRLRRGPFRPHDAARLIAGLSRGMAHVHGHGVLHRDLKPANVLFGDGDVPKLVDFGLARIAGEASSLTRTGDVLGTPSYMSPEQAQGLKGDVDERSDVYGLGAILYHCLTGSPPFVGLTAMGILTHVIMDAPKPPRALAPEVPAALEKVCLKALEKRPEDRYATAAEFAEALDGVVAAGKGPKAHKKSRAGVPTRSPQETLLLRVGAGAMGVLVLLGVLALAFGGKREAPKTTKNPRLPRVAVPPPPVEPTPEVEPAPVPVRARITYVPVPLAEGERFRARIRVRGVQEVVMHQAEKKGIPPMLTGRFDLGLTLAFDVRSVRDEDAVLGVTIEELSIDRWSPHDSIAFVSTATDAESLASPYHAALGRSFSLVLNRRTLKVVNVMGARDVRMHVWAKARELGVSFQRYIIEGFDDSNSMQAFLNKVLYVLPEDKIPADGRWSLGGSEEFLKTVVAGAAPLLEQVDGRLVGRTLDGYVREFRATQEEPNSLSLAWSQRGVDQPPAAPDRREGSAELIGGRLVRSSSRERFVLRFGNPAQGIPLICKVFAKLTAEYTRLDD